MDFVGEKKFPSLSSGDDTSSAAYRRGEKEGGFEDGDDWGGSEFAQGRNKGVGGETSNDNLV